MSVVFFMAAADVGREPDDGQHASDAAAGGPHSGRCQPGSITKSEIITYALSDYYCSEIPAMATTRKTLVKRRGREYLVYMALVYAWLRESLILTTVHDD
jgi:hypothetical protein